MLFPCIILRSVVNTRQTTDHLTLLQQHNPRMSPRSKELEVDQIHRKFESTSIHGFTIPEVLILTVLGFFVLVVVILSLQSVKRSIQELLDERRRKNRDLQYETSTPPPTPGESSFEPLLDYLGSCNLVWRLYSTKLGQLAN